METIGKKIYFIAVFVLDFLFLFSIFAPIFNYVDDAKNVIYCNCIGIFASSSPGVVGSIMTLLGLVLSLYGAIKLFRGVLVRVGDTRDFADRKFVFGALIYAIGLIISSIFGLMFSMWIFMALTLVMALMNFLFIYVHYKNFTSY